MFGKKKNTTKILIVEDDALLAHVLGETLMQEKFTVEVVENGLEAIDEAKKFKPHFILLDLVLPGLDGFEVLKQFKAEDTLKDIPVVVLSNLNDPADIKSVKALGATDYFIKANTEMKQIVQMVKSRLKL